MLHSVIIVIIQPNGNIGHHPHDGRTANNNNFTTTNHAATPTLLPLTIATGADANQNHSHQQSGSRLMKLRHHFSSHQSERVLLSRCSSELSELLLHCVLFACSVFERLKKSDVSQNTLASRPGLAIHTRTHANKRDGDPLLAISFRRAPTLFFISLALLLKNFVVEIYYRAKILQSPPNFSYSRCSASNF